MARVHVTGERRSVTGVVHSFLSNLPEMLGAMANDPRCLVAIVEFEDGRYVQFWVEPDGALSAEVVSNLNIGDAIALTPDDETALLAMGWDPPIAPSSPNWRVETDDPVGRVHVAVLVRRAMYEVLGERPQNQVTLRSFALERSNEGWREVQAATRVYHAAPWPESERYVREH